MYTANWTRTVSRAVEGIIMDTFDLLVKGWPILLALITLIIVLSKLDLRVAVLEEKVKVLFEQMNKMRDK